MAHWLNRLLAPQTIAIVGASERDGSLAAITHRQLTECGFGGQVYSVNPKYQTLFGDTCFPSLGKLPVVPDLVVYAISGLALEQKAIAAQVRQLVDTNKVDRSKGDIPYGFVYRNKVKKMCAFIQKITTRCRILDFTY